MIIKLILAVALVAAFIYAKNHLKSLPKAQRKNVILKMVLGGLVAVLLLGVATGRMHWVGAAVAALIPLFRVGFSALMRVAPFWLQRSGGVANFRTDYLAVKVSVQQAKFTGEILKGKFGGRRLESLSEAELDELEQYYQSRDTKSYYLIRVARQRRGNHQDQQSQSREQTGKQPFAHPAREEALQILGLKGTPSRDEIIAAHRRLINKLHPDRGGSDFLAARVNQAKDVLLKGQ